MKGLPGEEVHKLIVNIEENDIEAENFDAGTLFVSDYAK